MADPRAGSIRAYERRRRIGRLRAALGVAACVALTLGYGLVALYVVRDLHVGHVVQDGIDTGDVLAIPLLALAACSIVAATACLHRFEQLAPRRRRG